MDSAQRLRRRMLALALPVTAALYVGAEGLDPKGTDQVVTTTTVALKVLPIAASHSSQLFVSASLSELALGGVAVSYAAIAMLVRQRGSTTAAIAAVIGVLGAFCGAIVNVLVGLNLAAAATAHVSVAAAARILIANVTSWPGQMFTDGYAVAEYVAPILMGVALWRSRRVPRWLAVLFAIGFEVAQQTPSAGIAKVVLLMAPFAAAMVLLAGQLWKDPDSAEDPHPAKHPHAAPAVTDTPGPLRTMRHRYGPSRNDGASLRLEP